MPQTLTQKRRNCHIQDEQIDWSDSSYLTEFVIPAKAGIQNRQRPDISTRITSIYSTAVSLYTILYCHDLKMQQMRANPKTKERIEKLRQFRTGTTNLLIVMKDNPDMIGEVADLLLREDTTTWTMCMGLFDGKMLVSVRAAEKNGRAGAVVKKLVGKKGTGGGHQSYVGGQIPLDQTDLTNLAEMEKNLREKFIHLIGADKQKDTSLIAPDK